jgi:hypothetical protein
MAPYAPAPPTGTHQCHASNLARCLGAHSRADRQEPAMTDIVNLNQYRKRRERRDAEKIAAENRIRHGRSKVERQEERRENDKAIKDIDDKRLD